MTVAEVVAGLSTVPVEISTVPVEKGQVSEQAMDYPGVVRR
jgi:hypothetical protein